MVVKRRKRLVFLRGYAKGFLNLPKFLQINCFKYLSAQDLWNFYQVYPSVFGSQNNAYWKYIFGERIKFNRILPDMPWGILYVKHLNSFCIRCNKRTVCQDPFYGMIICGKCVKDSEFFKCVTKSRAKKEFCLSDKNLSGLEYVLKPNPYYRSAAPMTLYLLSDVKKLVGQKYESLEDEQEKREQKRTKMRVNKQNKIKVRREMLEGELRKQGLVVRGDSKLCQGYIDGTLEAIWTLESVVVMVGEMRWLFEYTPYKKQLDRAVESSAEDYHHYDGLPWGLAYRVAFEEEEGEVRRRILEKYPKPERWPWLKKKVLLNLRRKT